MSGVRDGEWQDWSFEPLPVLRALGRHHVDYVLIGGLAAVLHGSPLPTFDIDIAPAPGRANAARLELALAELESVALTNHADTGRALRRREDVSFTTPFGYVDIHHHPAGFPHYGVLRRNAQPLRLETGLTVRVAAVRDILASRTAAGDERQLAVLCALLELA